MTTKNHQKKSPSMFIEMIFSSLYPTTFSNLSPQTKEFSFMLLNANLQSRLRIVNGELRDGD